MEYEKYRRGRTAPKTDKALDRKTVWGAYIPEIMRSYPGQPIRGHIIETRSGKEFRPLKNEPLPRDQPRFALKDWAVSTSYDIVVQKMREYADEAIKIRKAEIARLDKFINEN